MTAARIEQAAALWLARREQPEWSSDDEARFAAWMDETMAHRAAYWRLEHGWREANRLVAVGVGAPRKGLHDGAAGRWRRAMRRPARWVPATATAAIAASLAITIGAAIHLTPPGRPAIASYQTARGGRQLVSLDDGSRVELNTATVLRAATASDAREVWLDRGEAFFDIAHRPDRRFVVHAGPRTVTVLGTRFSVRRDGDRVTVAVVSGRVRIDDAAPSAGSDPAPASSPVIVSRGDVAIARENATLVATAAPDQVETMTAWRDGRLLFDRTPLNVAVTEFNRYRTVPIRIADPGLNDVRIGGSFHTDSGDAFLGLLANAYQFRIERQPGEVVIRR